MNAAVRGMALEDISIDLEGKIDLPGFFGLDRQKSEWTDFQSSKPSMPRYR